MFHVSVPHKETVLPNLFFLQGQENRVESNSGFKFETGSFFLGFGGK